MENQVKLTDVQQEYFALPFPTTNEAESLYFPSPIIQAISF